MTPLDKQQADDHAGSELMPPKHVFPIDRNRQIHGMRGLAASLVFVFHLYDMASIYHFRPGG